MNAKEAFQAHLRGEITRAELSSYFIPEQPVSKEVLLDRAVKELADMGCTVNRSENSLKGHVTVSSERDLENYLDRIGHLLATLGDGCLWDEDEGDSLWRIDFYGSLQD